MEIKKALEKIFYLPSRIMERIQTTLIKFDREHTHFYRFDSIKRDVDGEVIVLYRTSYTGKLLSCKLKELVSDRDDILSGFNIKEIKAIISLANKRYQTKVEMLGKDEPKLLIFFSVLFVSAFLLTNITATKIGTIYGLPVTGAVFIHPFIYIFGNIITEVYGYKKIRSVIWGTMICNVFMVIVLYSAISIPAHGIWHKQHEYQMVLGSIPRVVLASMIAFFSGEFVNSYFLVKIKLWTKGRNLLLRILISSFLAISLDTALFVTIAFGLTVASSDFVSFALRIYFTKLFFDIVCYPIVRSVCNKVKRYEKMDIFDVNTDFTPFSLDTTYSNSNNFWEKAKVKP